MSSTLLRSRFALLLAALLVAASFAAGVGPAFAQTADPDDLDVAVRDSEFASDGTSEVIVSVTGGAIPDVLDADAFSVTENGDPVGELTVESLADNDQTDITTLLALDTSTSMEGELLDAIKAASTTLVTTLTSDGIPVGLLRFDTLNELLSEPTTDTAALVELIDAVDIAGGTALYDAVLVGVEQLEDVDGVRSLIVLADGEDNLSEATLDDAIAAASDAEVPITVIAIETDLFDPSVLRPLADDTDGRFITTDDVADFEGVFAEVAADVASQYRISYASELVDADELDIEVSVTAAELTATTSFVVANQRNAADVGNLAPPPPADVFDAGELGTDTALYIALGVAFVALLLFLGVLFLPKGDKAVSRTLRRGLTMTERRSTGPTAPSSGMSASAIGERAMAIISSAPKPAGYEERLQVALDRAGWQLRSSEFIAMRIGAAIGALALVWALTGAWWFGLLAGVAGLYGPNIALVNARQRRLKRFMEQLPDTLQLLSGTLKAGYGVLQAIDTIVKETDDPMASEFQRVLTEARLGLPLEDSLQAMAERVDSDDFRWVVVAMNIQRQVGGNLAELLETVSETLRGREQTRRQIQVLSAEGKLSAIILVALPFLLLFYMLLTNPAYLAPLITSAVGIFMSLGAIVLMVIGVFWMSRMIKIDV